MPQDCFGIVLLDIILYELNVLMSGCSRLSNHCDRELVVQLDWSDDCPEGTC